MNKKTDAYAAQVEVGERRIRPALDMDDLDLDQKVYGGKRVSREDIGKKNVAESDDDDEEIDSEEYGDEEDMEDDVDDEEGEIDEEGEEDMEESEEDEPRV